MYDVVVLGAGPGGYIAAIKAGRAGFKTALIEQDSLGGTCLNRGCIPTKHFLHVAEIFHSFEKNDAGLSAQNIKYDIATMYEKKNTVVSKLINGIEKLLENSNVEVFKGKGIIKSKNTVSIEGKEIEFKNLIIATGSSVFKPPIEGIENAYTSDDILSPNPIDFQSVIIIGGGVIGVEFATVYAKLGKEVTIIELEKTILPPFDRDIAMQQALALKKLGVKIINGAKVTSIRKTGCTYELKEKLENIEADALIVSIGRIPNVNDIGFENLGLEFDKRGIITDEYLKTNVENVFAIGDVVKGNVMLAHNAENQACLVVENLTSQTKKKKLNIIPSCVYSTPEIASVGISEKEAEAKSISVKIGKVPMGANGKSLLSGSETGFIKVLFDEEDRLVGCSMMCLSATDMIGAIGTLVTNKTKREDILHSIYPHPTVVEAFFQAVEDVEKASTCMIYKK
ncbi:MAG: dihydrolipoyl dehydrogenase [Treponema sp.]